MKAPTTIEEVIEASTQALTRRRGYSNRAWLIYCVQEVAQRRPAHPSPLRCWIAVNRDYKPLGWLQASGANQPHFHPKDYLEARLVTFADYAPLTEQHFFATAQEAAAVSGALQPGYLYFDSQAPSGFAYRQRLQELHRLMLRGRQGA